MGSNNRRVRTGQNLSFDGGRNSGQLHQKLSRSLTYLVILSFIFAIIAAAYRGGVHLIQLKAETITVTELPFALAWSMLRMVSSFFISLGLAFVLGLLAGLTQTGEKLILPAIDILQSIPIVAFFPASISIFIATAGGGRIGVEIAAIFLLVTCQAWNLAFAVYEAVKTLPRDSVDAVESLGARGGLKFLRLFAPVCVPRLVFNSILSWTNGWFFLVASEIISIGEIHFNLPGIGSFISRAAEANEFGLLFSGLAALTILILALDFLVWRPATSWATRFRTDVGPGSEDDDENIWTELPIFFSGRASGLKRATQRIITILFLPVRWIFKEVLLVFLWEAPSFLANRFLEKMKRNSLANWTIEASSRLVYAEERGPRVFRWFASLAIGLLAGISAFDWLKPPWPEMILEIPLAIFYSTLRLIVALVVSLIWILPLVHFSWDKPKLRRFLTTIAQIGASLPAIALFPLIMLVIIQWAKLDMEYASLILLVSGMQWYILFNLLGGVSGIPGDLIEISKSMGVGRWLFTKRLVFPAIRPSLVTGAITAWGGGWNALVVCEYVTFQGEKFGVVGIGALLARAVFEDGDTRGMLFAIFAMVGWIIAINSIVWKPLYKNAAEKYRFDG